MGQRDYHAVGIKLDSKRVIVSDTVVLHEVIWILRWEAPLIFLSTDYYAHDLYMSDVGDYFINPFSEFLEVESNMPLVQIYRNADERGRHRLGWASYRPHEIQADTTYTVTLTSPPSTIRENWASLQEVYGIRIPFGCVATCLWVPIRWCNVNEGGQSILLRQNFHPAGIHPLGEPMGRCFGLRPVGFLPIVIR